MSKVQLPKVTTFGSRLAASPVRYWVGYVSIFVLCACLMVLLFTFTLAGEIYDYQDSFDGVRLPEVDAIVCLAGGRGRITAAGDLWYRYFESAQQEEELDGRFGEAGAIRMPVLYFSGMGPQTNWSALSLQLRRGVLSKIRPHDVVIEKESSNTYSNALWFAHYAKEKNWKRILLLTSSYHMRRAHLIFDHVLKSFQIPIEVETFSVYQEPFALEEWRTGPNGARVTVVEYLKWVYYRSLLKSF